MKQDLTLPEVNAHIIARINKLSPSTPSQRGKMTVSQMLAHCQAQMRVALVGVRFEAFAATLLVAGGDPSPGSQVLGRGEAAHVRADLGQDGRGGVTLDAWDLDQACQLLLIRGQ